MQAKCADIGNDNLSDNTSVYIASDIPGYFLTRGIFKENDTSNETEALLWFNPITFGLFNITTRIGDGAIPLHIEEGVSTFRAKTFKYHGTVGDTFPEYTSEKVFTMYDITGNLRDNNPHLIPKDLPDGKYTVYVSAYGNNSTTIVRSLTTTDVYVTNYDTNGNGRIDTDEAVQAVIDYFNGTIPKQAAIAVVVVYFNNNPGGGGGVG